jgi:GMP synthase-like glutamine amidotransferase
MKLYYIQHEETVPPGSLTAWADSRNIELTGIELYNDGFFLPVPDGADGLIILGGSMNIYEEAEFPFLKESKRLIKAFIDAKKKVFGICLGGQLISDVLGAKVHKNDHKEIGWWEVQVRNTGIFSDFPPLPYLFNWHGDVFDLPEGATLWASTGISSHQAYTVGDNILAVQFHPEVNEAVLDLFLEKDKTCGECGDGPYSQAPAEVRELSAEYMEENKKHFFSLLDNFFATSEGGPYRNKLV